MIDLHCHLLPQVDDGPETWEEAVQMCQIAAGDGIKAAVATPHTLNGEFNNWRDPTLEKVAQLNALLKEKDISLEVLPGADVHLSPDAPEMVAEGKVLTLNDTGKYLLVELPDLAFPAGLREFVFQLKLQGLTPVISHPERNHQVQEDPEIMKGLVSLGALVQLTAMSITGEFGRSAGNCALALLRMGLAHVVASDAHSVWQRPPILSRAHGEISQMLGRETANKLCVETPQAILEGRPVSLGEPETKARSFWQRWFR